MQLHVTVTPDVKARADAIAARTGAPLWAVVEAALKSGTPDTDTGVPAEWNIMHPGVEALPGVEQDRKTA